MTKEQMEERTSEKVKERIEGRVKSLLTDNARGHVEQSTRDGLFNPFYVDHIEGGDITEVRCMKCGVPLRVRVEMPGSEPGVVLVGIKKLDTYREIFRPGKATILCCPVCQPSLENLSPEESDRVDAAVACGWIASMILTGKTDEQIKGYLASMRAVKAIGPH